MLKNGALTRLCSDVLIKDTIKTLWIEVEEQFESFLIDNGLFLFAMLPYAMKNGLDIEVENPLDERLFYQLMDYFIPSMHSNLYKKINIKVEFDTINVENKGAIGCYYSKNLENLLKEQDGLYPISYVITKDSYDDSVIGKFGLTPICVNSNFNEILDIKIPEEKIYLDYLYPFALGKLFANFIIEITSKAQGEKLKIFNSQAYNLLLSMLFSSNDLVYLLKTQNCKQVSNKNVIEINKPYLENKDGKTFLCANLSIAGEEKVMYFSVEEIYGEYLINNRCDAFVAAVITTAMHEGYDIICNAPVTRRILYWLNNYLIPTLSSAIKFYNPIIVKAEPIDEIVQNTGAVATGWTGGVDCFYTYLTHSKGYKAENSKYNLTHLFVNNNGAIEGEDAKGTLKKMVEKTKNGFALETGKNVVGVDTNIQDIFQERFLTTVSFRHCAVVLALQKLLSVYLVSSSYAYQEFGFKNSENLGYYETIVYQTFTTALTAIYCSGGGIVRTEKVKALIEFPLSYKYIHSCIYACKDNCTKCGKCVRLVLLLDALGVVDKYSQAFDLDWYKQNLDWCLSRIYLGMGPVGEFIVSTFKKRGYNVNKAKFIAFRVSLWRKFLDVKNFIKSKLNA